VQGLRLRRYGKWDMRCDGVAVVFDDAGDKYQKPRDGRTEGKAQNFNEQLHWLRSI